MGLFTKKRDKDAEVQEGKDELKKGGGFLKGLMRKKDKAVVAVVAASALCPEASAAVQLPSVEDSAAVDTAGVPPAVLSAASTQYCEALGISGAGFALAAQAHSEAVVQILEGAWEACSGAKGALGNRLNCQALADALKEAVVALDAHGQRFSQLPADQAEKLASQFAVGAKLVREAGAEGWLLRLAFGARAGPEAFSEVHSAVAEIVQSCVPAPAARHLHSLDYRDTSRVLRRLLKRLGSGSAVAGLRAVAEGADGEGSAQEEVAKLLDVDVQAVLAELAACEDLEAAASAAGAGSVVLDGTIRDQEFAVVFSAYAASGETGGPAIITLEGFARMLEDVGMASSEDPAFVSQQFAAACSGGSMCFEVFCECYQALPLSLHRQAIRAELGLEAERSLRATFSQYAAFGAGAADAMDSMRFAKLCKESRLTDKVGLPAQAVDVIFTQAKPREGRRLDFDGFITALALAAKQAGCGLEAVAQAVLAVEGPALNATQADVVPLHDDKSLYTGVYRNGMSVVDRPADSLAALVSREGAPSSPSKAAALSRSASGVASHGGMTPCGGLTPISLSRTVSGARSGAHTPRSSSGAGTPLARAGSGLRPADSAGLASGLSSGTGTPTAAGTGGGAPVPSLRLQLQKLQQQQKVEQQGSVVGGKEKGGAAPARGSNKTTPRSAGAPTAAAGRSAVTGAAAKSTPRGGKSKTVDSHPVTPSSFGVSPISGELFTSPPAPSDVYGPDLRRVFEAYASFGAGAAAGDTATAGLDGARFAKLCRECGLLNKSLNPTRVDLVFTKVAGKARRIDLRQFVSALGQLAEARGCSVVEVKRAIASSEGPQHRGTTPEHVRWHDDKSTFTGVYARGGPSTVDDKLTLEALTSRLSPRNTAPPQRAPPRARPSPRG